MILKLRSSVVQNQQGIDQTVLSDILCESNIYGPTVFYGSVRRLDGCNWIMGTVPDVI